jgi:arginyl-tRNA---protein transferase
MRYKGSFSPTYVLGKTMTQKQLRPLHSRNRDPESLDWNLLDTDFRTNLDTHPYYSHSGTRKRLNTSLETNSTTRAAVHTPKDPNPEPQIDYTTLELDSDNDSADETEIPEGSLFDYHVPGIMTKEEVERLRLGEWRLLVRTSFVAMKAVSRWDEMKVTDPQSIKGIVAELAAALGPEVFWGGSAVDLFSSTKGET